MSAAPGRDAPTSLRLTGAVDGRLLDYAVAAPGARVGFLPGSEIFLPVRGVSRRHAELRWRGGHLVLRDLESTNGTYLNGRPVTEEVTVRGGDVIQFGPVSMLLSEIGAGDDELGIVLHPPLDSPATEPLLAPSAEATLAADVERLLDLVLGDRQPDFAASLSLLLDRTGASGAALGEWDGAGEPQIFAYAGDPGSQMEHPNLWRFFRGIHERGEARACCEAASLEAEPFHCCCGLRRPGRPLLAVVVRGAPGAPDEILALMRLLLRMADRARIIAHGSGPPRARGAFVPLAIPLGFVRGSSPAMQAVYRQIERLRGGDFPILVIGETGVGKEHLVRLLHESSARASGPFVPVNCAAIPAELLEAEMFGVGRGVATGVAERTGKFKAAHGGTLFLDEIAELPLGLQAKLLRALESGLIEPVGGTPAPVDVRIVTATNGDPRALVATGKFRQDLYYRIAGYTLRVPPLRERRDDVAALVQHFLGRFCQESGNAISGVTLRALGLLTRYPWPGNVRELEHEARRLAFLCPTGQAIDSTMLSHEIRQPAGAARRDPEERQGLVGETPAGELRPRLDEVERRLVSEALRSCGGSQRQAAKRLGVSRRGLALKLRRLGLDGTGETATIDPGR